MNRPELKSADLEEVDRLVELAKACNIKPEVDPMFNSPPKTTRGIIQVNALTRAAEIMGLATTWEASEDTE